jgi:hypothetical protein
MALPTPKELLGFLKPYNRGIQELALALRQLVIEEMAPCHEYILEVYIISLSYGPTPRPRDAICYIGVIKDHINLGFMKGTSLRDPMKVLEGDGKQMRHIKIRTLSDLERPAIRSYLQEACERADHDPAQGKARTLTTAVKAKGLPKRILGTARL